MCYPAAKPLDAAGIRHPAPPIPFSALARSASPRPLMRFSSRRSRHRRPPAFPIRKRPRGMPRACRGAAPSLFAPSPLPQAQYITHSPCSPRRAGPRRPSRCGPPPLGGGAEAVRSAGGAQRSAGPHEAPSATPAAPRRSRAREPPPSRGPRGEQGPSRSRPAGPLPAA